MLKQMYCIGKVLGHKCSHPCVNVLFRFDCSLRCTPGIAVRNISSQAGCNSGRMRKERTSDNAKNAKSQPQTHSYIRTKRGHVFRIPLPPKEEVAGPTDNKGSRSGGRTDAVRSAKAASRVHSIRSANSGQNDENDIRSAKATSRVQSTRSPSSGKNDENSNTVKSGGRIKPQTVRQNTIKNRKDKELLRESEQGAGSSSMSTRQSIAEDMKRQMRQQREDPFHIRSSNEPYISNNGRTGSVISNANGGNGSSVEVEEENTFSSSTRSRRRFEEDEKNRPFTLPPGLFRPKQSLGQNFLSDQNYVNKIVNALFDDSPNGKRVVEIGSGPGALTRVLVKQYPEMTAIELDQRAIEFLGRKLPELSVLHMDVLDMDWPTLAAARGGPLNVIGNLPYYVTSQVLFNLADNYKCMNSVVITCQWEVAERMLAKPSTKAYGIPSVVFQLYCTPHLNFKIPPSVFYPVPKVDSALVTLDFTKPHPKLHLVRAEDLRKVVTACFRQRRKMMRQSLKHIVEVQLSGGALSEKWALKRPEQLRPHEFIDLTGELFGWRSEKEMMAQARLHSHLSDPTGGLISQMKDVQDVDVPFFPSLKQATSHSDSQKHNQEHDGKLSSTEDNTEEATAVWNEDGDVLQPLELFNQRDAYVTLPVWRSSTSSGGRTVKPEVYDEAYR